MPRGARDSGFTLVEVILVLFLMLLMFGMAVPVFSKLLKTSRVDQATHAVFTALWQTRSQAMRTRTAVALYYGDDTAQLNPQPSPGVLPPCGRMEIWTVRYWNYPWYLLANYTQPYYPMSPGNAPDWYPYNLPLNSLTPLPLTLPESVRVLAGNFNRNPWSCSFSWSGYKKDPTGELKRHMTVFAHTGSLTWTYPHVLIFDEVTGDHRIIQCAYLGMYGVTGNARPVMLKEKARYIGSKQISDYHQLGTMIRDYPGDR
ncbi:MAG: prepilin-type N-terminal cleavage/methylation domain-containing protein [Planctomycetes bacterium]|nr:prepilin-type N-terminal cleavage/methylation domain-containing protein [Planctomycetota bacterium]